MAMIDIQTSVDGSKLAQLVAAGSISAGSRSNPTSLGSWQESDVYISMTTQNRNVSNDSRGEAELQVNAHTGDSVRWSMETFDNNLRYTAHLYDGQFNPVDSISSLLFINLYSGFYIPTGTDPNGQPTLTHKHTYVAQAVVMLPKVKVQYTMSFILVDNGTGNIVGYFSWDPFINVVSWLSGGSERTASRVILSDPPTSDADLTCPRPGPADPCLPFVGKNPGQSTRSARYWFSAVLR